VKKIAFLFDVDGVITSPLTKSVTNFEIIEFLANNLASGHIVALNTGRSTKWVIEKVFPSLQKHAGSKEDFSKFIIVGEKGGTWSHFKNGDWLHHADPGLSIPEEIRIQAKELASREPFSTKGSFDLDPKESMASWEMREGQNISEHHKEREPLVKAFKKLIENSTHAYQLKLDVTTIGLDIENKHVGKHVGAQRILDWMKKEKFEADQYVTAGDSLSDFQMATHLHERNLPVIAGFMGGKDKIAPGTYPYYIYSSSALYSDGTVEFITFLKNNSNSPLA
jgi:hydroxymethylpyrimidine pyrophosphatase-like HAD family hydrolase